jgi:GT2 family glycosyltransferase
MLVRRALFQELGGFARDFFMYAEDLELCARIRARGARVAYEPALQATHAERGGAQGLGESALVHTVAGHAVVLVRHGGRARAALVQAALVPCFGALGWLGGACAWLARSPHGATNARAFRAATRQALRSSVDLLRGGDGAARA